MTAIDRKRNESLRSIQASNAPPQMADRAELSITSHSGGNSVDQSAIRCHRSLGTMLSIVI